MQIFTPISNDSVHGEENPGGRVTSSHTLACTMLSRESPGWASCPFGHWSTGDGWRSLPLLLPEDKGEVEAKEKSFLPEKPQLPQSKHPFLRRSIEKRVPARLPSGKGRCQGADPQSFSPAQEVQLASEQRHL